MPIPACGRRCCAATCPTCGRAPTTRSCCRCGSSYTAEDNFNAAYVGALRDAVLRHDHRRRLLPQHQRPRLRAASIEALKEDRHPAPLHLFLHEPFCRTTFPRPARFDDGRAVYDTLPRSEGSHHHRLRRRFDRRAGAREAARLRARAEGAELHPRQRDRHHRPAACRRPARTGLPGHPRQPDHQCRARADGQGPHAALLHADRRHARHAGRCRAPRHRSRRRRGVRLRHSLFDRVRHAGPAARDVQRAGLPRRRDGAQLLDA